MKLTSTTMRRHFTPPLTKENEIIIETRIAKLKKQREKTGHFDGVDYDHLLEINELLLKNHRNYGQRTLFIHQ